MSTTEINSHYGKNIKWTVYRNGYNAFVGNLTLDGAAYDISSRTFTAYIRTPEGNADKLTLTEGNGITNGGAEGTLTIALTEAQLATLPRDRYFIVVEHTISDKDYPLCQGYIEITDRTNPGTTTTSVTIPVDINGVTVNMAVTLGGGGELTAESIAEALTYTPANAVGLANHIADVGNPHGVTATQIAATQTSDYRFVTDAEKAAWNAGGGSSLYLPNITGYLGAAGSDASITTATAVDRIPTTGLAVGKRISAIVTISGTERRLYTAELVTPADATANVETSPSVIRPNDFNAATNNKVWREVKNSGIIDVSHYGVVPNTGADLSSKIGAIITAASSGDTLIFPPGTYNTYVITVSKKLRFIGFGAKIQFSALSANMFNISIDGVTIKGFEFVGQGRNNATYANQGGIRMAGCSNILISDCMFDSFPYYCIMTNTTHISDTSTDFGGINIVNCHMMRSGYGFYADTRGEYAQLIGCSIVDCNIGTYIKAGNINFTGSQILDCSVTAIELATAVNDAHGLFSGCQINHNTKAVVANAIQNGHFFRGCNIYYGDVELTDCVGFVFTDCVLEGLEMKFDGCTGCRIEGCTVPGVGGVIILTKDWNGNMSDVIARNNLNLLNQFVAGWNDQARVDTTDAAVTTLLSYVIPASTTVILKGYVVARRTVGTSGTAEDGAAYEFKAAYKNIAGTATLIGSATITAIAESQAGWDVTLPVSSGNVNISVTGAAGNNITWYLAGFEAIHVSN